MCFCKCACVLTVNGFLFGWDKALYSIIFQYVSTQVIDICNKHYKKNTLFFVTDHPKEIAEVDPAAFVNVMRTDQIYGRFYMRPND